MFDWILLPRTPGYASIEAARDLLSSLQVPADAMRVLQVRRLLAQRPIFGEAQIRTEAAQFLDRVRSSGCFIAATDDEFPVASEATAAPGRAHVRWARDYIPRVIPPGHHLTSNVRFRNAGPVVLRHAPPANITIAVRWYLDDGRPMPGAEDFRTPLPLDLKPGQELTLPITIAAPLREGSYRLQLIMVEEGLRFLEEDAIDIRVSLRHGTWTETPPGWSVDPEMVLDYRADHVRGLQILRGWIDQLKVREAKVLEIGGNAHPAVAEIEGELHNADVDLLGLQMGSLVQDVRRQDQRGCRVRHLCADADDLPYADRYFDAIVMFASLHHFPDPARTLAHVATKVRAGGFVGIFCEPVGHVHPGAVDPAYLRELQRGVNEQSFLMREWAEIIRRAQLWAAEAMVEGGSLKARLVHAAEIRA